MINLNIDYQLILILCGLFLVGYYSWVFYSQSQKNLEDKISKLEKKLEQQTKN